MPLYGRVYTSDLDAPVLKLGFFYPLPKKKIKNFIRNLKKVLIVEELEPYLEKEIKILAKEVNPGLEVFGASHLAKVGEIRPEYVVLALSQILGIELRLNFEEHYQKFLKLKINKRYPQLCPGCPYWLVFSTVKKLAPKDTIFGGEVGCYMLAAFPPHNIQDYLFCMGSSIGIAHGIKKVSGQKLIAFL